VVADGHDANVVDYTTAQLYHPATNQWTSTGSVAARRLQAVSVLDWLAATGDPGRGFK
jgi:hypothetical protein